MGFQPVANLFDSLHPVERTEALQRVQIVQSPRNRMVSLLTTAQQIPWNGVVCCKPAQAYLANNSLPGAQHALQDTQHTITDEYTTSPWKTLKLTPYDTRKPNHF